MTAGGSARTQHDDDDIDVNYRDLLPLDPRASVVDVGCGTGRLLEYLLRQGLDVSGVDNDASVLAEMAPATAARVDVVSDLEAWLDERPSRFDLVVARQMIYYLPPPQAVLALSAMRRALKPGGRLLVEVFNGATLTGPVVWYKDPGITRPYTEHSIKALLVDAGFTNVEVRGSRQAPRGGRRAAFIALNRAWQGVLRCIYVAERGLDPQNPRILTRNLIAVAQASLDS